jgi:hypothetical protein
MNKTKRMIKPKNSMFKVRYYDFDTDSDEELEDKLRKAEYKKKQEELKFQESIRKLMSQQLPTIPQRKENDVFLYSGSIDPQKRLLEQSQFIKKNELQNEHEMFDNYLNNEIDKMKDMKFHMDLETRFSKMKKFKEEQDKAEQEKVKLSHSIDTNKNVISKSMKLLEDMIKMEEVYSKIDSTKKSDKVLLEEEKYFTLKNELTEDVEVLKKNTDKLGQNLKSLDNYTQNSQEVMYNIKYIDEVNKGLEEFDDEYIDLPTEKQLITDIFNIEKILLKVKENIPQNEQNLKNTETLINKIDCIITPRRNKMKVLKVGDEAFYNDFKILEDRLLKSLQGHKLKTVTAYKTIVGDNIKRSGQQSYKAVFDMQYNEVKLKLLRSYFNIPIEIQKNEQTVNNDPNKLSEIKTQMEEQKTMNNTIEREIRDDDLDYLKDYNSEREIKFDDEDEFDLDNFINKHGKGRGRGRKGGDLWSAVKSVFVKADIIPKKVVNFMKQYGNLTVAHVMIGRTPVQEQVTNLINLITDGAFREGQRTINAEVLFHLFIKLECFDEYNKKYSVLFEKNQVANIEFSEREARAEMSIGQYVGIPLKDYIQNGVDYAKSKGRDFWYYKGDTQNCQVAIIDLLEGNHMNLPEAGEFILQDIPKVFEKISANEKLFIQGAVDVAIFMSILGE